MHELVLPVQEVGQRAAGQAHGGAFADHAPHPTAFLRRELGLPAQFVDFGCGRVGVLGGQANHGQRDQLFGAGTQGQQLATQVVRGIGVNGAGRRGPIGVEQANGLADNTRSVVFHAEACPQPGGMRRELAGLDLLLRRRGTAVISVTLHQPQGFDLARDIEFARIEFRQQGVTAHGTVVVHPEIGVFGHESTPLPILAEQQQPVVSQAIFLVGTGKAAQEFLNFAGGRGIEPGAKFPVGAPRLQHMATHFRQQRAQGFGVPFFEGVAHFQNGFVRLHLDDPHGLGLCRHGG